MRGVTPKRLLRPGTAALSDAMRKGGAMRHDMQCRSAKPAMAGPAFTVRVHASDILMVAPALAQCPKGHVLVIDGRGELNTALWGELTTYSAQGKGLAGVVIDGASRDIDEARELEFPVYARSVVPMTARNRVVQESYNQEIQFAGVQCHPGDLVFADGSGIIIIPKEKEEEVVSAAEGIYAKEQEMAAGIRKGYSGLEMLEKLGYEQMLNKK